MPAKVFDPRSTKVTNPFVQAYLEKQESRSKPLSDRQKLINLVLIAGLVLNLTVLLLIVWTARTSIMPQFAGDQRMSMGEAMHKIGVLEANMQNLRTCVEFHKNAYYKLEQDHETLKAAVARVVPMENMKDVLANYMQSSQALQPLPNPQLEAAAGQSSAAQSALAAQQQSTGQ